jgi:hypothetical protein
MPTATIDGSEISYEIIGHRGEAWIVRPGGRSGQDTPGGRELAQALFLRWTLLAATLLDFPRK